MITKLNRAARRQAEREIKKSLKKHEDRKSPFARTVREEMMQKCNIEIVGGKWYATLDGESAELLTDYIGHGKNYMRPWASKKEASRALSASYNRIADNPMLRGDEAEDTWHKRGQNTALCGNQLEFTEDENDGHLTLVGAKFCHDPLCPLCNWRKSIKNTVILTEAMDRLIAREDRQRLLHIVLTVPNCRIEDLRETFQQMSQAFSKITKQSWWKKRFTGYYSKLEWTISENPEMIAEGRIAHPHMHVLATVSADYFEPVPEWINTIATIFRQKDYNPTTSAGRCGSYADAVCHVRNVVAESILADAADDGVDIDNTVMWRTQYRGRYQRLIAHVTDIADKYRPAEDANKQVVKQAIRAFVAELREISDPLYIDEPEQHVFLNAWRAAFGDESIKDVNVQAVKCRRGSREAVFGQNPKMRDEMRAAVKELTKYVGKDSDYILPEDPYETDWRVSVLREQLANLHMVSSGGLVKKYIAEVKAEWKADDEDLIHTVASEDSENNSNDGEDKLNECQRTIIAVWNPRMHAYVIVRPGAVTQSAEDITHAYCARNGTDILNSA